MSEAGILTHLCQNNLLNFSGNDWTAHIDTQITKVYRDGGICCQQKIFVYESTLQPNEIFAMGWIPLLGEVNTTIASCSVGTFQHSHFVMSTEQKGNEGTFYNAVTGAEICMKGEDLFHKLYCDFPEVFVCFLLELWLHS